MRSSYMTNCIQLQIQKRPVDRRSSARGAWDFPHEDRMRKLVKEHFDSKDLLLPAKRKTIYDNAKRFYAL